MERRRMGGEPLLVMLFSGGAGCGKSLVTARAQEFCFIFCQSMGIPFDEKKIYFFRQVIRRLLYLEGPLLTVLGT